MMTGIKPTGQFHLGNYMGFIPNFLSWQGTKYLMIADAHSWTTPEHKSSAREMAACLLACDVHSEQTYLYKQSDIGQIFQISWILSCFCGMGLLNRAHAFKATEQSLNINAGVYTYAILMAADMIATQAQVVPVGKDQLQHIEIANDIIGRVNHFAGNEIVQRIEARIADTSLLPGLDGRKMSKSYNNTLPLFGEIDTVKRAIAKIPTSSAGINDPKEPELLFTIYSSLTTTDASEELARLYQTGVSWKQVKDMVFDAWSRFTQPKRERYRYYLQSGEIDIILMRGKERMSLLAQEVLDRLLCILR